MPSLFKNHHHAYSKIDMEDPEDKIHRRAQFMIYKTLQEAQPHAQPNHSNKKKKSSSYIGIKFRNLRIKVVKRLKKLRKNLCLNVSLLKISVHRQVVVHLKTWRKLISGKEIVGTSAITSLPHPVLSHH